MSAENGVPVDRLMLDEAYSDNGAFSHYRVLCATTNKIIVSEDKDEETELSHACKRIAELEAFAKKCLDVIRCEKDVREDLLKHDAEVIESNDALIAENKRLRGLVGKAFDFVNSQSEILTRKDKCEWLRANGLEEG